MLGKYRACVAENLELLKAGEEVDFDSACSVQIARIEKYITSNLDTWKNQHPSGLSENKQGYFQPRQPYF